VPSRAAQLISVAVVAARDYPWTIVEWFVFLEPLAYSKDIITGGIDSHISFTLLQVCSHSIP
jgi:hypothetical protein